MQMLFDVAKQLDALTETLRLVSNIAVPVEPGQKVEVKVLSGVPDLFVTDKVLDNPLPAGVAQLLTQIPVEIQVSWSVTDGERTLEPGVDFLATNGMKGPSVDFLFKPPLLELGTVKPLVDDALRIIKAKVTLRAWPNNVAPNAPSNTLPQAVVSKEIPLSLFMSLVPLEIPAILALFRFEHFRPLGKADLDPGFVLMIVPENSNSYLQDLTDMMLDLLQQIDAALRPLRTLISIAAFLARLTVLRHALSAQPMLRIVHFDEIDKLNNVHMRVETRFGVDFANPDMRADNRVSSLIFIGIPGRKVTCFVDTGQSPGDGAFQITLGNEMIVLLPSLNLNADALAEHPEVEVIDNTNNGLNNFDDSLSSIRFEN